MELKEDEKLKLTELMISFEPGLVLEPCCDSVVEFRLSIDLIKNSDLDALEAMAVVSNLRKYHSTRQK